MLCGSFLFGAFLSLDLLDGLGWRLCGLGLGGVDGRLGGMRSGCVLLSGFPMRRLC